MDTLFEETSLNKVHVTMGFLFFVGVRLKSLWHDPCSKAKTGTSRDSRFSECGHLFERSFFAKACRMHYEPHAKKIFHDACKSSAMRCLPNKPQFANPNPNIGTSVFHIMFHWMAFKTSVTSVWSFFAEVILMQNWLKLCGALLRVW